MKKFFKTTGVLIISFLIIGAIGYFSFIYEKPVDQKALSEFLRGQPIIDVHVHTTKGFSGVSLYNPEDLSEGKELDQMRLEFMQKELNYNNVVLALGGGSIYYATRYYKIDNRIWPGVTFPYHKLAEEDAPVVKPFLTYEDLEALYNEGELLHIGEGNFMKYGIAPSDSRLEPYWRIAAEKGMVIGVHAEGEIPDEFKPEPKELYNEELANPDLLRPIHEKDYFNLE